jgi:hypothetical protein
MREAYKEKEPYEVLEEALDLIWEREHWCQGSMLRYVTQGDSETETLAYCSLGALETIEVKDLHRRGPKFSYNGAYGAVADVIGGDIAFFNDTHTHAEVVAVFQTAIRNEKKRAGILIPVETPEEVAV